ncbi:hypothetical protein GW17_00032959, partial [Ensete ventricosum]
GTAYKQYIREERSFHLLIYSIRQRHRRLHTTKAADEERGEEEAKPPPRHYLLDRDRQGRAMPDRDASRFSQFSLFFKRLLFLPPPSTLLPLP